MKIIDIQTQIVKAPLKTPFKTALRKVTHLEDLVVTICTNSGLIGYGEGASTAVITGETLISMRGAIDNIFRDILLWREIDDFNSLLNDIDKAMVYNWTIFFTFFG